MNAEKGTPLPVAEVNQALNARTSNSELISGANIATLIVRANANLGM